MKRAIILIGLAALLVISALGLIGLVSIPSFALGFALCVAVGVFVTVAGNRRTGGHELQLDRSVLLKRVSEAVQQNDAAKLQAELRLLKDFSEAEFKQAEADTARTPWYAKMISTAGVLTFAVLLVTTSVQTLVALAKTERADLAKEKTEFLKQQLEIVSNEVETARAAVFNSAREFSKVENGRPQLAAEYKNICRAAMGFYSPKLKLGSSGSPSRLEFAQWASEAGRWDVVKDLFSSKKDDGAPNPEKLVMQAYSFYYSDLDAQARQVIEECEKLDRNERSRIIAPVDFKALQSAIKSGRPTDEDVREIARTKGVSAREAEQMLSHRLGHIRRMKGEYQRSRGSSK